MKIAIRLGEKAESQFHGLAAQLVAKLIELGFDADYMQDAFAGEMQDSVCIELTTESAEQIDGVYQVMLQDQDPDLLLESVLRVVPVNFDALPLLIEGDSKIVRLWTDRVVVTRLKPTVYSYTMNRYGEAPGTDDIRAKFTAALFRKMRAIKPETDYRPCSGFLAEIQSHQGRLLVERRVETCNLETRIKRYHIGSPLHRYRYTECYDSTQSCGPLKRWSRLDEPVVCFDWRHPLQDEQGNRLADEPISDDYARVWMYNVDHAKEMARQTFLWMERLFEASGVRLVDMCLLIDRPGRTIYGEISPDCIRVHLNLGDPASAEAAAKDVWRAGGSPDDLRRNYDELYRRVFETTSSERRS